MDTILRKIFDGELKLDEQVQSQDPGYKAAWEELDSLVNDLESILDGDEYEKLDRALDLCAEMENYQCYEFFRFGFGLGRELDCEARGVLRTYHLPDYMSGQTDVDNNQEKPESCGKILRFKK